MITLTDERGLIQSPQSWDEIESLPGYVKGINPSQHKLKAIIGSYHLNDIHCGLSCNQPHNKGYIVVTQSGVITNIGNDCGKKYFDVDFITFKNQHHRALDAKNNRDLLFTFSLKIDDLENEIDYLRKAKDGIDWIYKTSQALVNRNVGCPEEVVKAATTLVKSRSNILKKDREATAEEIKALRLSQNTSSKNSNYVADYVATISGLEILYEENDLKKLTIIDLEERLKTFKRLSIDTLRDSELSEWAKWVNLVDTKKQKIIQLIEVGHKFLKAENLQPFTNIISDFKGVKEFEKFLKQLP